LAVQVELLGVLNRMRCTRLHRVTCTA